MAYQPITTLEEAKEGQFYKVADLKAILENKGLNYSIFSIMDAETWKCKNYKCGKRHAEEVDHCVRCGSEVIPPSIPSPRTRGGGRGSGHRRYTPATLRKVVEIFEQEAESGQAR